MIELAFKGKAIQVPAEERRFPARIAQTDMNLRMCHPANHASANRRIVLGARSLMKCF
jgi:hypothetical protein